MTNDATKTYCVRLPHSDQREVTTSDGTRQRVEYVGNIDVVFYGRSETAWFSIDWKTGFMFSMFDGQGNRVPTAHHMTARAKRPMELVRIDTAGPFPASLGDRGTSLCLWTARREAHPQQECGRHPRCREAFHCKHGSSTSVYGTAESSRVSP